MSASIALAALSLAAAAISNTSYELPEGGFVLRHEAVISAPLEAVWQAFTTAEGWMSWAVPFARVDFRLGGLIETSYDPAAQAGDAANIHSRILAYLPGRMMAFRAERPPPGFQHPESLAGLFSVVEIAPHGDGASLIRLSGVGYTDSPEHRALREFFERGNAWSLERLVERFTSGPVDWSAQQAPDVSD